MNYNITEYDKALLLQPVLQYKVRVTITDKKRSIVDVLYGISNTGGIHISSDSNIRRTFSFTLQLEDFTKRIEQKLGNWIGLYYEIDIGILDLRSNTYQYYPNGRFCITSASTSYDATTNSISLDLSDRMAELDGTRNGQIGGAPTISIPKEVNGIKQTIRNVVINLLTSSTDIDKYIIDDIGEWNGMPQNNSDYIDYRIKNDEWNVLPYDLEYSVGVLMSDILFDIRDLYPNCQMYFDAYDNFCFDMIPSLDNDIPSLDNSYLQTILTSTDSENVTYNITDIKNVTEIFGKSYDVDRYAETVYLQNNTYSISLSSYDNYKKYDMIAFISPGNNLQNSYLKINSLPAIPIYVEYTTNFIPANTLEKDVMSVFRIYKIDTNYVAYYLGQYQPHALCILTNNVNDSLYTKKYFSKKYNLNEKNIYFRYEEFSPFSVQRQGELLDSKSGDNFDDILSDSSAISNAKYYNRLSSTMFDTVTITTVLIPWLDVNVKINYKKLQEDVTYSYIVQSRQDNFEDGTSTITMYRFMQLYEERKLFYE